MRDRVFFSWRRCDWTPCGGCLVIDHDRHGFLRELDGTISRITDAGLSDLIASPGTHLEAAVLMERFVRDHFEPHEWVVLASMWLEKDEEDSEGGEG